MNIQGDRFASSLFWYYVLFDLFTRLPHTQSPLPLRAWSFIIQDKDPLNKGFLPAIVLSFIYTG